MEGLDLAIDQKQRSWQLLGLGWLAHYHLNIGDYEAGLDYAEQSVEIAEDLGSPLYKMRSQLMLGTAYRHMHRTNEAIAELEQAEQTTRAMGLATDEVLVLYQLIRSYIQAEVWDKAETSYQRLVALVNASEMREYIVRTYWIQSML
ncbi:MAG: tetratricopeptide repeat protein, partial [Okeania sp. SIO3B3]|nr:tetratricopeptide repeat protein [Okeania sp. SIO3B3]